MRVLVVEFITGGGIPASDPLPPSLAREGELMLTSLLRDLGRVPGIEVVTTRDARLPRLSAGTVHQVTGGRDAWDAWARLAWTVDAVWPVAPETAGELERLSRLTLAAGALLLNSRPDAVAVTARKSRTAERLGAAGIAVAPTSAASQPPAGVGPWVAKPDDGAGCEETVLLEDLAAWARWRATRDRRGFVLQPFVPGVPASLSMICREGTGWLLSVNRQAVRLDHDRFVYAGGTVAGLPVTETHARLASAVAAALPGLWGHVGVDFVETPAGPVVIEVNPRLTTSYAALGRATGLNVASLVLDLLDGPPALPQRRGAPVPVEIDLVRA
ncbi:ATP-grasp domain-containing protein [Arenibaculum pallidiluteum]|uniref:ATP-grasp domain-containing protein n=1 Tax=Arenibaculum pallidiluteum TaxID=2812559 RepID=UPI001A95F16B|nr:ATP-grasp domain-containing protein [Arenibaculum pallidiluteum]